MSKRFYQDFCSREYEAMDLEIQGLSRTEIADALGVTPATITNWRNKPHYQHMLALRRAAIAESTNEVVIQQQRNTVEEAKRKLDEAALDAATVLVNGLVEGSANTQRACATDILDRVGIAKITKSENKTQTAVVELTEKSFELIHQTLATMRRRGVAVE